MKDLIVVIPGIMGSVLERNGRQIWGLSGSALIGNLMSLGGRAKELMVPIGLGDDDPLDGVTAPSLMPSLHLLPGFWKVDGYSELVGFLEKKFTLSRPSAERAGNLLEFPYDWRLSNALSARRLSDTVVPELERWKKQSANPEARLILICHSMGGLVARWFLEVLGGGDLTRMLITIGTPYRGSINALETLVNGFAVGRGWFSVSFDDLVRSFPAAYQLLPTYRCVDAGDGKLQRVSAVSLPNVSGEAIEKGLSFHARLADSVGPTSSYKTFAIKGIEQPTGQSALLAQGQIEPRQFLGQDDWKGDGTVPRISSHPPEWENDGNSAFSAQKHASLQNTDGILTQLLGILMAGQVLRPMGGSKIGLVVPDMVMISECLSIECRAEGDDPTLALSASCRDENGVLCREGALMRSHGDGTYSTAFEGLGPGAYRITVESATPARPVDAVTDVSLVWDPTVTPD